MDDPNVRRLALLALAVLVLFVLATTWWLAKSPEEPTAVASLAPSPEESAVQPTFTSTPLPTAQLSPTPVPTIAVASEEETESNLYLPQVEQADIQPSPTAAQETVKAEPTAEPAVNPLVLADWPALSLPDWPRPAKDNGLCLHNIIAAYYPEDDIDKQIRRLQDMNMRWTVMLYGDELQIKKAAPRFRDAGIMVVWRKMLRPHQDYYGWGRDIELLRELGMEPYMQVYNEPSLSAEWEGKSKDRDLFLNNFVQAARDIYNAGGYVGLQFVSDKWLLAALQELQRREGDALFGRMFLIPHPYGLNHPPDYTEDSNAVLGFLHQAEVVRQQIGFVPPMIAGEGGWKWNATDDHRYPPIDAALHRDYHRQLFEWFRTGDLSNGEPLPDYLFAFCPWLLAAKLDDSAWYDSFAGDHTPTIEAIKAIPPFERKFSWSE
jgi:hypothetical protein